MLQNTDYYSYLICPFTGRNLRFLSEKELETVNERIGRGELYFHPGIQVSKSLSQALVTEHQTYIYPIFDDIFYLKRETAIVAKNRTENYLKRISQIVIDEFERKYSFDQNQQGNIKETAPKHKGITSQLASSLRDKLPKKGKYFLSMCSGDIDAIHNLVFGTDFDQYLHVDFELSKLRAIAPSLRDKTVLILADNGHLPFKASTVDALVSFDPINKYTKEDQKVIYQNFKSVLSTDAASVLLYDSSKPLHAKVLLGADKLSNVARGVVMPWRKAKKASFHFEGVQLSGIEDQPDAIVSNTSFNQQFS